MKYTNTRAVKFSCATDLWVSAYVPEWLLAVGEDMAAAVSNTPAADSHPSEHNRKVRNRLNDGSTTFPF